MDVIDVLLDLMDARDAGQLSRSHVRLRIKNELTSTLSEALEGEIQYLARTVTDEVYVDLRDKFPEKFKEEEEEA